MEFERLVNRHKDAVYRQMVRVCGNRDDAEDVLVEALVAAYRRSGTLRDEGAFRSWVTTIGRRICTHLRRHAALAEVVSEEVLDRIAGAKSDGQDFLEREQMVFCVHEALDSLPTDYREVYVLRDIEGKSNEETAQILGLSVAAVKSRLHRARAKIRENLDRSICMADTWPRTQGLKGTVPSIS